MAYPGSGNYIAVFVKNNGILAPCRVSPQPDGAVWVCPCGVFVIRATYGVLSGMWRCQCGREIEVIVNGVTIDMEELGEMPAQQQQQPTQPASGATAGAGGGFSDEGFLRGMGIAPSLAITED